METRKPRTYPDRRLSPQEGIRLLRERDLLELGQEADEIRRRMYPEEAVTFVVDSNPNYTNVCVTDCLFCAFYRRPGHPEAYTLTVEQVLEKVEAAAAAGATTVLLQGGHNPAAPLEYYLNIVREIRARFPQVTPHCFSASEIRTMAEVSGLSVGKVLEKLYEAGQRTLPGGGAEILSERVRRRISPKKGGPETWLEVHRLAHKIGFRSTATMMYGHVETEEDIVEHWERIRSLQDETGGFLAFIPWSFKPSRTVLGRNIRWQAGPAKYLRILAAARLYLDNFDHIQASWFSEGKKTGQVALHFGADDFGGTLLEENVHREADFVNRADAAEVAALIAEAGFRPWQRTTLYEILKEVELCPRN